MNNENEFQPYAEPEQKLEQAQFQQGQYQPQQGQYQSQQGQYQPQQGQYQPQQGQYQPQQGQYQPQQGQYQPPQQGQYQPQQQGQYQPQGQNFPPQYNSIVKLPCTNRKAAIASLLLGLGSFLLIFLAWISCGVMAASARNQLDKDQYVAAFAVGAIITFIGLIVSIMAIVFSVIAKKSGYSGMATAGLVLGIIGLVICFLSSSGCALTCSVTQSRNDLSAMFGKYY